MVAKLSRNFSGQDLVKHLSSYGYEVVRQNGSHIRLTLKDKKVVIILLFPITIL